MRPDPDAFVLEALVHRELTTLRPPDAPLTLLPRIMAAVEAWASRPWYQRAWFTWPVVWQAVAILLLSAFATAAFFGAEATAEIVANALGDVAGRLTPPLSKARIAMVAVIGVVRALLAPAIVYRAYTFAFVVAMCAACAVLAAALQRLSAERTQLS